MAGRRGQRSGSRGPAALLPVICLSLMGPAPRAHAQGTGDAAGAQIRLEQRVESLLRDQVRLERRLEELEAERLAAEEAARERDKLERRVLEVEATQRANNAATRSIIADALTSVGAKINESVVFGGTFEFLAGWSQDFDGGAENQLLLNTAELDFEIQVNDWTLGSIIFEYVDGTDVLFPTTEGFELGVDRVNIDTAFVTIGDTQRFWPFATLGRMIVPFGISTGNPVADVLSLDDPLTIEAFETKADAILIGFEFPTPDLVPAIPIPSPPRVEGALLRPLIGRASRALGYQPIPRPPPPATLVTPPPSPPPFNAGIYFYNGKTFADPMRRDWTPENHIGAWVGYRTKVFCTPKGGRGGEELGFFHYACPWSFEFDVDFNTSVFDSRFLVRTYQSFLDEIGIVPGMAANLKATLGPLSIVGEWNGAISRATFDDALRPVSIRPTAWQVSLGYQFGWNPGVEVIGAQGTYIALGYSESYDLAGVTRLIDTEQVRVGFVPRRRLLVTLGEWVLDGVRVAVEYARVWDYPVSAGGTGAVANGVVSMLTYEW